MCLQFGFVLFWQKDFGTKAAHKMLVKLTPDGSTSPKDKLLCFKPPQFILTIQNALAFNWEYVLPSSTLFTVASFPFQIMIKIVINNAFR